MCIVLWGELSSVVNVLQEKPRIVGWSISEVDGDGQRCHSRLSGCSFVGMAFGWCCACIHSSECMVLCRGHILCPCLIMCVASVLPLVGFVDTLPLNGFVGW